jgi:hypothetical protein
MQTDYNSSPMCQCTSPSIKNAFGQALLDSAQSIVNPQYRTSYLPLFAIQIWLEIHNIHDIQKQWQASLLWMDSCPENVPDLALNEAHHRLSNLRWNSTVSGPKPSGKIKSSMLTRLLGVEWINDDLMDIMIHHLQARLEADVELSTYVMITDLAFMREVEKAKSPTQFDSPPQWLIHLEQNIKHQDPQPLFYFPAHITDQHHWICFDTIHSIVQGLLKGKTGKGGGDDIDSD